MSQGIDIKIQNSLTKKKEPLSPIKGKTINMYSCGVTVYDKCHIGHARSLYVFDVIRRYFTYRGFSVNFVRNITDIDDKIIQKANDLGKDWKDVVKENIKSYEEDLNGLNISKANVEPRATENISEMIIHIQGLIDNGSAYEADGDVYFNVRKFSDYGKLSGQSIEKMKEAVCVRKRARKKDSLDFALWKKSKEGEPFWESPWSQGRPGWHIECSVMSMKYLGCETLDIHAGGRDLIFPHHENEIAQSEALTGKPFAKYWIHHGLLTINGQKMSKSLGNFITIKDALKEYVNDDLKLFFLSSQYSSPIDYTKEKMKEASLNRAKLKIFLQRIEDIIKNYKDCSPKKEEFIVIRKNEFEAAMDDDFNTPRALGTLFNLVTDVNRFIDDHEQDIAKHVGVLLYAEEVFRMILEQVFGLLLFTVKDILAVEDSNLLFERAEARANKDFKRSDEIRDLLREKGIIVEDGKEGQTWRRA